MALEAACHRQPEAGVLPQLSQEVLRGGLAAAHGQVSPVGWVQLTQVEVLQGAEWGVSDGAGAGAVHTMMHRLTWQVSGEHG